MHVGPPNRSRWLAVEILPHEPALRAWLTAKRLPGVEVEDIIQDTYSVLVDLEAVDHITHPKTYMFRTAYSLAVNQLRRQRIVAIEMVAEIDAISPPDETPSVERQVADRQELRRVAEAIADLKGRTREIFILRKIEGMSQREVAKRLGVTEGVVEKQVAKGLETLVRLFGRGKKTSHTSKTQDAKIAAPAVESEISKRS